MSSFIGSSDTKWGNVLGAKIVLMTAPNNFFIQRSVVHASAMRLDSYREAVLSLAELKPTKRQYSKTHETDSMR